MLQSAVDRAVSVLVLVGNMYKLRKFACHYNFCNRTVSLRNSLPNEVVEGNTTAYIVCCGNTTVVILLIPLRMDLINTGLIKRFCSISTLT